MTGPGPSRLPTVAVLLREMSATLRAASSVHITGTVVQDGKTTGVNLGLTRSGELSGQISESGAVVTVLAMHGHTYLKLSAAFLRVAHLPATACRLYCGKYLEAPAAESHVLLGHVDMASLTHSLITTPVHEVTLLGAVEPRWPAGLAAARFTRNLDLRRSAGQAVCPPPGLRAAGPGQREPVAVERSADPRSPARQPDREPQPAHEMTETSPAASGSAWSATTPARRSPRLNSQPC